MKKINFYLIAINVIGFSLLCLIIWVGGPLLSINNDKPFASIFIRLLLIGIVALISLLIYLIQWLITKRANEELVNYLTKQDINDKQGHSAQEIKELKKYAREIFALLKKTRVQSGKRIHQLLELPWYIVLGAENSGKSTAIYNSGLNFPLANYFNSEQFQKLKKLQSCRWWITEQAVFLEISRFNEDWDTSTKQAAWYGLLKLLKKYKGDKAINGAIITCNVTNLLTQSEQEINSHWHNVKQRLQDVNQNLSIHFPVYFLFNQCDQIAGFSQFFAQLSATEREQAWGVAFPIDKVSQQNATTLFAERYQLMLQKLYERSATGMSEENTSRDCELIHFFPQQMELLKQPLIVAIKEIFITSKLYETIYLRGCYFCSATQEGISHDFILSTFAKQAGLEPPVPIAIKGKQQPYFLKQLFHDVILAEANLSDYSEHNRKLHHRLWIFDASVATSIIGISTFLLTIAYQHEKNNAAVVAKYIGNYAEYAQQFNKEQATLIDTLPLLNSLMQAADVYNLDEKSWILNFQLYHLYRIQTATNLALLRTVNAIFLPKIFDRVEQLLYSYRDKPVLLANALHAYLAFDDLTVTANQQAIINTVQYDWQRNFHYSPAQQAQLLGYLQLALNHPYHSFHLHQQLIRLTQQRLGSYNPEKLAYNYLQNSAAQNQNLGLNIMDLIGSDFSQIFTYSRPQILFIPFLYTNYGYNKFYLPQRTAIADQVATQLWNSGMSNSAITDSSAQYTQKILLGLDQLYGKDYYDKWYNLLYSLSIVKITSLTQAIQILQIIANDNSPLKNLLNIVAQNTQINLNTGNINIKKDFQAIGQLTASKQPAISVQTIQSTLSKLAAYLTQISQSPDTARAEFDSIKSQINANTINDSLVSLRQQIKLAPPPIRDWLLSINNAILNLLVQDVDQYINRQWQTTVIPAYNSNIASFYPFNLKANNDVSLPALIDFFGANGTLEQFYNTYLQPFINTATTPWQFKSFYGSYNFPNAQKILTNYQNLLGIKRLLFSANMNQPQIELSIEPVRLDTKAAAVQLQLGTKTILYRHGPTLPYSINWPLPLNAQGISLTIRNFDKQKFTLHYDGAWALFRLLQAGKLTSTLNLNQYLFEVNLNGYRASFMITINGRGNLKQLI